MHRTLFTNLSHIRILHRTYNILYKKRKKFTVLSRIKLIGMIGNKNVSSQTRAARIGVENPVFTCGSIG